MGKFEEIGTPVGPYGTVIEHPYIRGLLYMVIAPAEVDGPFHDLYAVVLADPTTAGEYQVGTVTRCGGYIQTGRADWIVVE